MLDQDPFHFLSKKEKEKEEDPSWHFDVETGTRKQRFSKNKLSHTCW